jgi:hypothetical protein
MKHHHNDENIKNLQLKNWHLLKQTEKIDKASASTCKHHSSKINLRENKQRCWLKMVVLNQKKFNLHFEIKIRYQINIVKIQEIKYRFWREGKIASVRQYAIGNIARTCNSASAQGLLPCQKVLCESHAALSTTQ